MICRIKRYIGSRVQLDLFEAANIRLEVHTGVTRKKGNQYSCFFKARKELKSCSRSYVTDL